MILACPACSTRFSVDSGAFGPGGRRVRCGACRHVWHQPAAQAEDEEPLPSLFSEEPAKAVAAPRAKVQDEAPVRPPIPTSRSATRRRRAGIAGLAWSLLALVVIVVLGGGVVAKDAIMAAWPESERIYAKLGMLNLPAGAGLELRKVSWKRETTGDVPVLLIEGEVANISKEVRPIPKIRGALMSSGGRVLSQWVFAPPEPRLLPGETVKFRTELRDPPAGAERLTMNFSRES
jgi:predicted Zn finger-like uncharacterized protein